MESYFSVEYCLGPFVGLDESRLDSAIQSLVSSFGPSEFSSLWEEFSFMDGLFEMAADAIGDEDVVWTENEKWIEEVRKNISAALLRAANNVYLKESNEATWRELAGKSWIFSGGTTWDGYTTEIAEDIRLVRQAGLDLYLSKVI